MNTARSGLFTILRISNVAFDIHPNVKIFIKGVYNQNPLQLRYIQIWDTSVVVNLLQSWFPASKLSLVKLTKKLVVLILLVTQVRDPRYFRL